MLALTTLLLAFVAPVAPLSAEWRRPVPGAVARPFSYGADPFRAGWHRGVDLAAPPGTVVRAACSGVVATARPGLLTLRCGPWRVTHLPLASVSVVEGAAVRAGRSVGTLGTSGEHTGLHLGVRRAGDRFAYVDPVPLLTAGRTAPPPAVPAPRTTRIPRGGPGTSRPVAPPASAPAPAPAGPPTAVPASPPAPVRAAPPASVPASPPAPVRAGPPASVPASPPAPVPASPPAAVRVSSPAGARGLAPWPAWVGLALLLLGAAGGGVRSRVRRRRAAPATAVASSP
jgi:hypothetical protein